MNADIEEHDPLTEKIIGCAFNVANVLGHGFLERVYENAMVHELSKANLLVRQQVPFQVKYDGVVVGDYQADLRVGERVLVELKATKMVDEIHMAQCLNYLKASDLQTCLLINFGTPRIAIKRISLCSSNAQGDQKS